MAPPTKTSRSAVDNEPSPDGSRSGPEEDFLRLGPVELRVTDAERAARFWEGLIGLTVMGEDDGAITLGSSGRPVVMLRETASRSVAPGHSGLYHLAVHYPTTLEFGRVLARLAAAGESFSPVDHLFSQAFYLRDPDGIGVELTLETPWRMRELGVDAAHGLHTVDQGGGVHRPSEPLALEPLVAEVEADGFATAADGAYIGHVHLSVPDLEAAVAFYRDRIGMVEHFAEPSIGLADLSAGGAFTHRLALNTFYGPGVPPAPSDMAGMDRFTIRFDSQKRLEDAGAARVHDPAGNEVDLIA